MKKSRFRSMELIKYGLTGAPGCGKSTALGFFLELGWHGIDADGLCRKLHETPGGDLHERMAARWGAGVLRPDGTTCREKTAEIVFRDKTERDWLESILYPVMAETIRREMEQLPSGSFVMLDAPLLFEKQWDMGLDGTIAVWCPPDEQMRRLLARSWTREHALARMAAHWPQEKKLEKADYGIINGGTLEELKQQCAALNRQLRSENT